MMLAMRDGRQTGVWSALDIMTVCMVQSERLDGADAWR
jgi:hypothetical protein